MKKEKEHYEEIARIAYEIYERRGTHGQDVDDWLEAERIVMERISIEISPSPMESAAPKKKAAPKKAPAKKAPRKKAVTP